MNVCVNNYFLLRKRYYLIFLFFTYLFELLKEKNVVCPTRFVVNGWEVLTHFEITGVY